MLLFLFFNSSNIHYCDILYFYISTILISYYYTIPKHYDFNITED